MKPTVAQVYEQFVGHPPGRKLRGSIQYRTVVQWLEENEIDPWEFFYFMAHYYQGFSNPARVRYWNLMATPAVQEEFLCYLKERPRQVALQVETARELLNTLGETYQSDWVGLLRSHKAEVPAPVLVDYGLMLLCTTDLTPKQREGVEKLVEKSLPVALYVLKGRPEFLTHCPYLKQLLEADHGRL